MDLSILLSVMEAKVLSSDVHACIYEEGVHTDPHFLHGGEKLWPDDYANEPLITANVCWIGGRGESLPTTLPTTDNPGQAHIMQTRK